MKSLKNPMTNAIYIASITAIYAMIFIVSSEFVSKYAYWLSDSRWSLFIQNKNMKFIGLGMIGIAIIIDIFSALRRKKYDEYQIIALEKIMLFNGLFITIIFPFSTTIYLWLISLTASKELSILLLKLYNDGAIGISSLFLDIASAIKTDNQLLIRSVRFMQVESP